MDCAELNTWLPAEQQKQWVTDLIQRVGVTRIRAECFVRLWIYLLVKQQREQGVKPQPPFTELTLPLGAVVCTHREAADLFYNDKEQGSDRAAGMMLDKLTALGLIRKHFDGNTTRIEIQPIALRSHLPADTPVTLQLDDFDPRCDTIPIANLLATNYNWMNSNQDALPHRIARLLRRWADQYAAGMRVLRRTDNLNPVGFYLLYPTASESDANFFAPATKGMHLSALSDVDPFRMATVGDRECVSVFVRSWMIDPQYAQDYRLLFLQDVQATLQRMRADFPNLCDIHTMIIHPVYEAMAFALGFQRTSRDSNTSVYWIYLAIDRFLDLDLAQALPDALLPSHHVG